MDRSRQDQRRRERVPQHVRGYAVIGTGPLGDSDDRVVRPLALSRAQPSVGEQLFAAMTSRCHSTAVLQRIPSPPESSWGEQLSELLSGIAEAPAPPTGHIVLERKIVIGVDVAPGVEVNERQEVRRRRINNPPEL